MAASALQLRPVIVGTAGHIDHGKTRLVAALTGIDTDRLPEEKARGISIDLGFAHWEGGGFRFGVVDVPGHERFVRNMVAGASGVNVALLVVAADDGVMPQTREHLEIMDLLAIPAGVIAITKTDLVEPGFVELVQDEIAELVAGTFLEGAAIVPCSAATGAGIEQLKQALANAAERVPSEGAGEFFRLPIDRVFTLAGHGTIVTGSAMSGDVQAGDTLALLPEGRSVRVRSVEHHGEVDGPDETADRSSPSTFDHRPSTFPGSARRRTAVNLTGVKTDELGRGMELVTPGWLEPTRRLVVELRTLSSSPLPIKDRLQLRLHIGTSEATARVLTRGNPLGPGERGYAELRLTEPIVAAHGQRFILRRVSPALTVGGGRVLDPHVPAGRRIRDLAAHACGFAAPGPVDRLSFLLASSTAAEVPPREASWRAGVPAARFAELLAELERRGEIVSLRNGDRALPVHRGRLERLGETAMRIVRAELARNQPRRTLPRATVLAACREIAPAPLPEAVVAHLVRTKQLAAAGDGLGPADMQVRLTKAQEATRQAALSAVVEAGLSPPTVKEIAAAVGRSASEVESVLKVEADEGRVACVAEGFYYDVAALEQARRIVRDCLAAEGEATTSRLREALGVTRKFALPLCEYFDSAGVTVRKGDVRVPGPRIDRPFVEEVSPNP
ncbi:MAG: selenocysteine-specific translation elongation factor [Planctomycetales bacterium]